MCRLAGYAIISKQPDSRLIGSLTLHVLVEDGDPESLTHMPADKRAGSRPTATMSARRLMSQPRH